MKRGIVGTMIKQCKICGTEFETVNSRYCCCSDNCRKIHYRNLQSKNRSENREKRNEQRRFFYRLEHRKGLLENPKKCAVCQQPLSDRRQTFCLDCLLKDYKYNNNKQSMQRLFSRGYSSKEIWDEINTRGI